MRIKPLIAAAVATTALMAGIAPANAVTVFPLSLTCAGGSCSGGFFRTVTAAGDFTDVYNFTLPVTGAASSSVTTTFTIGKKTGNNLATDIDFSSIVIDGVHALTQTGFDPAAEHWEYIAPNLIDHFITLGAGPHTLTLNGKLWGGVSTYAGDVTVAVPEPATWALMMLGIGAVGYAMRRRQSANVRYNFA